MPDYEKMYFELFNLVTDAIELLKQAQQTCEKRYIESGHSPLILLEYGDGGEKPGK